MIHFHNFGLKKTLVFLALVLLQMKWAEFFSTIVSRARIIEVLTGGIGGTRSGSLVLVMDHLN